MTEITEYQYYAVLADNEKLQARIKELEAKIAEHDAGDELVQAILLAAALQGQEEK